MNFHVLTLFPDMIEAGLHTSVTGRALQNGYIHLNAVNIRDYSKDKHKHVDDYPYGGGAGMVMQPEPIYLAYEDITQNIEKKPRVVYVTPQGAVFNQSMAEEFAKEEDLIFLCGHYEGVDERILEEIVTDYVSIGEEDYVCVMTRGHKDDTIVQEQILRTPAAYIGVIGSRRKKASVFRVLKEDGFTDRDLERITTPIGLEIGAETPAEIAISIAAQMIEVRAKVRK